MLGRLANWGPLLRQVVEAAIRMLSSSRQGGAAPRSAPPADVRSAPTGDRARRVVYAPDLDGAADPGEIVWAWVPFEEDDGRGKDRPLLVVGRGGDDLLGLMLSSSHKRDGEPDWAAIGSGAWDREGRESFVRLDRVLEVAEHGLRREGAVLDRDRFERVAARLRDRYGWT
jgi:PemK-like, MazF-like toxin of type II toxin-antitoxin system